MENTLQSPSSGNLMNELGSWNKQENKFRELFGDQALKDKDFQKMKLAEYDRLWQKYNGKATTTDEKAILVMLKFQRRKLEKALYPGLITRLLRRGKLMIKNMILRRRENNAQKNQSFKISYNTIPVTTKDDYPGMKPPLQQSPNQRTNQRYGNDIGRRLKKQP